ncbi:MAG TPA: MoaD/ThiS family protein [Draconibacterium sp.]|nr:MoaD/ThiS family protein [Draconibacterium sp.]
MELFRVKAVCFAGLRKYFGSEVELELTTDATFKQILEELAKSNPDAREVLDSCRIAVDQKFVSLDSPLNSTNIVFLIPPSSGG